MCTLDVGDKEDNVGDVACELGADGAAVLLCRMVFCAASSARTFSSRFAVNWAISRFRDSTSAVSVYTSGDIVGVSGESGENGSDRIVGDCDAG